jgi:hypothetical protein
MIVYCTNDLMFASKIAAECQAADVPVRPARTLDMLRARLDRVDDGKANHPVSVVFIELTRDDALAFIRLCHSHPDRPGVVAFGPHVETERLAAAREAGADEVLTRGAFTQQLPTLIRR